MSDTDHELIAVSRAEDRTPITPHAFYTLRCQLVFLFLDWNRRGYRIHQLENNVSHLHKQVGDLTSDVDSLKEEIALLKRRLFGKNSEKHQNLLPESDSSDSDHNGQGHITVASHTRRKKQKKSCGRQVDTSRLPRYTEIYDLSPEERVCPCCQKDMAVITETCSEKVDCLPEFIYLLEEKRLKYACRDCNQLALAPKAMAPIPKAMAGINLLVEVLLRKYRHHMPLYRQSQMLSTYYVDIADNTLGNWVMTLGNGLMPLMEVLWQELLSSGYLQADETPIKLLEQDKKGYIWSYFSPEKHLVYFEVADSRSGKVAESRLKDFKGLLATDGYSGYDRLRKSRKITGFACLTHARRKFSDIVKSTNNKTGIAAQVIYYLEPIYEIEAYAKEKRLTHRQRKRLRQKKALPLLKELYRWLKKQVRQVPPKSTIGKAIAYFLRQWPYIIRYVRHGRVEIDTNGIENQIRIIALGRRNFLFMRNIDSGRVNALFFTLLQNAVLNDLNPRLYMHYLLSRLHDIRQRKVDLTSLLPNRIDVNVLQSYANEQIAYVKKVTEALHYPEPIAPTAAIG